MCLCSVCCLNCAEVVYSLRAKSYRRSGPLAVGQLMLLENLPFTQLSISVSAVSRPENGRGSMVMQIRITQKLFLVCP